MISRRLYEGEKDFWRVRRLLIDTTRITPIGFNWEVRRWDGKRFHNPDGELAEDFVTKIRLWEDEDRLVAVVHPEGSGDAQLQVHPDYRHLEEEMIAWAEVNLAADGEGGARTLNLFVNDYDAGRRRLLAERGYAECAWGGVTRHLRLGRQPLATPQIAPGYTLRTTRSRQSLADSQAVADLLNAAFGRTSHTAQEIQVFTRLAPSFRPDLDLVAEAADGTLAAYVGIAYDPDNRLAIFEPVCTHPEHLRRGLARTLMQEGLLRLRALGAQDVIVGTGDMIPANRLYDSIGFTEAYRGHGWEKCTP
jgi:predicted N-acetyltransferase YhbS